MSWREEIKRIKDEIDQITDPTGRKIEPGIKIAVTGLKLREVHIHSSCQGHSTLKRKTRPSVVVGGPNLRALNTKHWKSIESGQIDPTTVDHMEREREEERRKIRPLVRQFNKSQGENGPKIIIRRLALGADEITPTGPAHPNPEQLKEERKTLKDFGRFLLRKPRS